MKKFKVSTIVTVSDEYFEKKVLGIKQDIESGNAKKQFYTDIDKEEGMLDVEITFEELLI